MTSIDQQLQVASAVNAYLSQQQPLELILTQLTSQIETAYVEADPSNNGPTSAESLLWTLWHTILFIAKTLPHTDSAHCQTRLTSLLSALKARDTPTLSAERLNAVHNKIPWSQGPLWQNLTIWGWEVRESFDMLDPVISGPQEGTATTQEWVNLNAFLARLTQLGVSDHSFLGLSVVTLALEGVEQPLSTTMTTNLDGAVASAAVWLLLAGSTWYRDGWEDVSQSGIQQPAGSLWQGPAFKIDRARLGFWKGRLRQILDEAEGLNDAWKTLARDAVGKLEALEAEETVS
jgi:hypothetical protein